MAAHHILHENPHPEACGVALGCILGLASKEVKTFVQSANQPPAPAPVPVDAVLTF